MFHVGLNVMTTKKRKKSLIFWEKTTAKKVNILGEEKCTPWENPGCAYEKRAPPYVGMGPPNG